MQNAVTILFIIGFIVLIGIIMWDANRQVSLLKSSEEEFPNDNPPIMEEPEVTEQTDEEKIF